MLRVVIDKSICSPINSNHGIKLSLGKPLNNSISLNITRSVILRQYCGIIKKHVRCYKYGSGNGTSSVIINTRSFVTKRLTPSMEHITNELHEIIYSNKNYFNLRSINTTMNFNHYTVIIHYLT